LPAVGRDQLRATLSPTREWSTVTCEHAPARNQLGVAVAHVCAYASRPDDSAVIVRADGPSIRELSRVDHRKLRVANIGPQPRAQANGAPTVDRSRTVSTATRLAISPTA